MSHYNDHTVMVIEKAALDGFKAALDAAGLPWQRWIGSNLQPSESGGLFFQAHNWKQAAKPELAAQIQTFLGVAAARANDGVHIVTEADLTANEKASKYGVCDSANWQAALARKTGVVFATKKGVV